MMDDLLQQTADFPVTRSCLNCYRRKVRCNKDLPCATCARTGSRCTYPELERKKRTKRLPVSAILGRLAQLEKKVSTLSNPKSQPNGGKALETRTEASNISSSEQSKAEGTLLGSGGHTRYFSDAMMASIAMDVRDGRPYFVLSSSFSECLTSTAVLGEGAASHF